MSEASESQWFYEKDGEEAGPLPEAELLALLKAGLVFPDTLLWTESMVDWQPALELEPFRSALREGESVWTPAPRPWVRFWARQVDLAIYEAVAFGFLIRMGEDIGNLDSIVGLLLVMWMILMEAMVLQWTGTTVGKWLLNINLTRANGEKLNFNTGLYRTSLVWVRGLGLGLPIINLIAMAIGLRNLTLNQESSWDRDGGTVVRHRKVSAIRWVGAFLIMIAFTLGMMIMLAPKIEREILEMRVKLEQEAAKERAL